jgi:hypothetical protein
VDLGDDGIDTLVTVLHNSDEKLRDVARLPSKYNFDGGSLRDVYDFHLTLKNERSLHPTLLIVAQHQDYKKNGVLLVNLDTDLKCSVDICRVKASDAILLAVNLMIANLDWEDVKDQELLSPSSDDDPKADDDARSREIQSTPASHSIFGVYGTAGADMTAIRALLEPDWRNQDPKTYWCQIVGSYTRYPDPWTELIKHHPWNCQRSPRLCRQWFICADTKDPKENGVLLVHMDWDGNIARDPDELLQIGMNVVVNTERYAVEDAIATLRLKAAGS